MFWRRWVDSAMGKQSRLTATMPRRTSGMLVDFMSNTSVSCMVLQVVGDIDIHTGLGDSRALSGFRRFSMGQQPLVAGPEVCIVPALGGQIRLVGVGAFGQSHQHL